MNLSQKYGIEEHGETTPAPVNLQEGETPKEGFDENLGDEQDVAKPATTHLDPASDVDTTTKTKDDGHQTVVSQEEIDKAAVTDSGAAEGAEATGTGNDEPVTKTEVKPADDLVEEGDANDVTDGGKPASNDTVNVLPDDIAGKNTTVSNEATLRDVYESLNHFRRMSTGIEGYLELSRKALERQNGVDTDTAAAIKLGLEAMDESLAEEGAFVSLEAFDGEDRETSTIKMIARLEGHLGRVNEARDSASALLQKYSEA